jgi:rhodanese-related sulfurtransferase
MKAPFDRPVLIRTASLLASSFALGLGINSVRPSGVSLIAFEPPTTCTAANPQKGPITEMAPHEAMHLCGRAEIIFADTREHDRFAAGHIAEAMHLPCSISAGGAEVALKKFANAKMVIVYGQSTEDAREVADTLRLRGLATEIHVLRGGFAAWEQEGLACTSGPCRECSIAGSKEKTP